MVVLLPGSINEFRVTQMIQDKTLSAENDCSLFKDGDAVLNHLGHSLRASRIAVVRGCRLRAPTFGAPLGKDMPLPARRV